MLGQKKTILFDIDKILAKINIGERDKVAELGCGNFGFFVFPLARLVGKQGKVYAVDILKECLEEIKSTANNNNIPQIETVWSNLEIFNATKIETASIDAATLIGVLNQSQRVTEMLKEASRLLKTNGNLLIIEWKKSDIPFGPEIEKRLKPEEIKEKASKLGLGIKEEFEAGPYHYGLILRKF
jgi:ubiquinone/menaquinone biosynthesis C-methylase UbiE